MGREVVPRLENRFAWRPTRGESLITLRIEILLASPTALFHPCVIPRLRGGLAWFISFISRRDVLPCFVEAFWTVARSRSTEMMITEKVMRYILLRGCTQIYLGENERQLSIRFLLNILTRSMQIHVYVHETKTPIKSLKIRSDWGAGLG